jgi:hypothetical protein
MAKQAKTAAQLKNETQAAWAVLAGFMRRDCNFEIPEGVRIKSTRGGDPEIVRLSIDSDGMPDVESLRTVPLGTLKGAAALMRDLAASFAAIHKTSAAAEENEENEENEDSELDLTDLT